jgi:hypothetical protein
MPIAREEAVAVVAPTVSHGPSVEWGAIIAGTVFAVALSAIFMTFGSAIGLSLTSPYEGEGWSATAVLIAMALWLIWIQVSTAAGGGYLAGRLLRRRPGISAHENEIRDGSHGLLVWALGSLLAGLLAAVTATGVVTAAGVAAMSVADRAGYYTDVLLRTDAAPTVAAETREPARAEIGRILQAGAMQGDISDPDKARLGSLVSTATGLPATEAEKRVNDYIAEAKATAEKARKGGIVAAFVIAASLLISALAGFWAAVTAGQHRDENRVYQNAIWWRKRPL